MEVFNLTETTVDALIKADTLVIEQLPQPGFPDLLVIVRSMMPIFVWIQPFKDEVQAKQAVEANVQEVGAMVFNVEDTTDLARLIAMIEEAKDVEVTARMKVHAPSAPHKPSAEDMGFDPVDEMDKQVKAAAAKRRARMLG